MCPAPQHLRKFTIGVGKAQLLFFRYKSINKVNGRARYSEGVIEYYAVHIEAYAKRPFLHIAIITVLCDLMRNGILTPMVPVLLNLPFLKIYTYRIFTSSVTMLVEKRVYLVWYENTSGFRICFVICW